MTVGDRLRSGDVIAMEELAGRGAAAPDELAALVGCLGHERKAVQRPAAEAFAALAARDATARAALEGALATGALRQRWGAAFALSLGGDPPPTIVPVLLETLGADDGDLRWAAAAILLGVPDRGAVASGLHRLLEAGNAAQRKMALYCLRDLGVRSSAAEAVAIRALADVDEGVQLAAMAALARLALDRGGAAGHLVGALETASERVRRAAAAALGVLGEPTPAVVAALEAAAASPDAALARAAAGALRALSAR